MTENQRPPIIQLHNVVKVYQTGDVPFMALKNVNLDIYDGEFLGITGKSGAGKTTLLNMIAGISDLTSGSVDFQTDKHKPLSIHTLNENQRAQWRGENVGIIYQSFELMPSLNLVDNVMLPPDFLGNYRPIVSKKRALELLEMVDILEHAYKIPAHISGGQKQRVAIARALVNDPRLIIADEPTGNLDSVTAETIYQIFEQLVEQGKTVVMVTHDFSLSSRFSRWKHIVDGVVGNQDEFEKTKNNISLFKSRKKETKILPKAEKETPVSDQVTSESKYISRGQALRPDHPAVILRDVSKIFMSPAGKFQALKSINMQLNYGQFISIVGKSGSGKSTLLNMITGIDHPTAGEVIVGNEKIYQLSSSERALWRGKNMGVVFQFFQLLPTLTLLENTMLPMDFCNIYTFSERPKRAMELLELVGLANDADKLPASVSSGQQQSAAIARALATDPMLILADEPTGNLDSRSAANILNLFEQMASQGKTILIVTHDNSITRRTDQTIILSDGEIIDQTVSRALPLLSHPQMMAASQQAKRKKFAPNATILQRGKTVDHFFMIVDGDVEVVVNINRQNEKSLAQLGSGQFFGEIELIRGGKSIASVRAGKEGAEVALLPKEDFYRLIDGSPLTRSTLKNTVETRLAEHKKHKRRKTDI